MCEGCRIREKLEKATAKVDILKDGLKHATKEMERNLALCLIEDRTVDGDMLLNMRDPIMSYSSSLVEAIYELYILKVEADRWNRDPDPNKSADHNGVFGGFGPN